jgi:hypothetical protein
MIKEYWFIVLIFLLAIISYKIYLFIDRVYYKTYFEDKIEYFKRTINNKTSTENDRRKKKAINIHKRILLLKKSYEQGFITLKEYKDMLKKRGYTVENIPELSQEILKKYEEPAKVLTKILPTKNISILDKNCEEASAFVLPDGTKLRSLKELLKTLDKMDVSVFNHHTTEGRNDFANWIIDVFKYDDVAEEVRNSQTIKELINTLKNYE